MFQVLISPGTVGTDDFVLQLMSGEGNLLPVKEATLVLSLPGRATERLERKAAPGADGARGRRANPAARSLARARRGGDGVPEYRAGRRFRGAGALRGPFAGRAPHCDRSCLIRAFKLVRKTAGNPRA
jgi:hypothetical protein